MKNLVLITALIFTTLLYSCKPDDCNGKGYLDVTNSSTNTVQRLLVDGVNYGLLEPGDTKEISLAAGQHYWKLVGVSGGCGCNPAAVIIVECETSSYSCRGK